MFFSRSSGRCFLELWALKVFEFSFTLSPHQLHLSDSLQWARGRSHVVGHDIEWCDSYSFCKKQFVPWKNEFWKLVQNVTVSFHWKACRFDQISRKHSLSIFNPEQCQKLDTKLPASFHFFSRYKADVCCWASEAMLEIC